MSYTIECVYEVIVKLNVRHNLKCHTHTAHRQADRQCRELIKFTCGKVHFVHAYRLQMFNIIGLF